MCLPRSSEDASFFFLNRGNLIQISLHFSQKTTLNPSFSLPFNTLNFISTSAFTNIYNIFLGFNSSDGLALPERETVSVTRLGACIQNVILNLINEITYSYIRLKHNAKLFSKMLQLGTHQFFRTVRCIVGYWELQELYIPNKQRPFGQKSYISSKWREAAIVIHSPSTNKA